MLKTRGNIFPYAPILPRVIGNEDFQGVFQRNPFIFTVKTDNVGTSNNDQFTLPLVSTGAYDFTAYFDGTSKTITSYTDNTLTFPSGAGTYVVRIVGTLNRWAFNNAGDEEKYLSTDRVGTFKTLGDIGAFYGCTNHVWNATDAGNLVDISSLFHYFRENTNLNDVPALDKIWTAATTTVATGFYNSGFNSSVINRVDTSGIVSFQNSFWGAFNFNQDISNFNFEAITTTAGLTNFLRDTPFDDDNYDKLLISMEPQTILAGQTPHFGTAKWKFGFGGQTRFDLLSVKSFTSVTDGGQKEPAMGCWLNPHNSLKASTNPSDGTSLVSWKDLSDNDLNAEDATGFAPLFKTDIANGEPMVYFNGSNNRLDIPADAVLDALFDGGGFFICAILPNSDGQNSQGRIFSQGGGNCHLSLRDESSGTCRLRLLKSFGTTSGVWDSTGLDININEINIIAMEYDSSDTGNDPVFYINSTAATSITESSTPVGTPSTPTGIAIGNAGFSNRTFDGYLGDLGFFKSVPSSTEKDRMIHYLATKYGVTL